MSRFSKLEPGGDKEKPDEQASSRQRLPSAPRTPFDADVEEGIDYDYHYYCEKGDGAFFEGDFKRALTNYSRAIQQDGTQTWPWCMQVWCLVQMGQTREADLWSIRAEEMFPNNSAILSMKAITHATRGRAARAIGTSDYAFTCGSDLMSWIARGFALLEGGSKNAYSCFDKVLESSEGRNDWKMLALSAFVLLRYRKFTQALKPLKLALALKEDSSYLWLQLGRAQLKMGMTDQAKNAFEQALELNPRCAEADKALRTYQSPLAFLSHSLRRIFKR